MLKDIPIVILCGGLGTRLRRLIPDRPKVLVPFHKKVLLDITMELLQKNGFEKIILSVGFMKEQVKEHCEKCGYKVTFSEEDTPLGTGGAIKKALDRHIKTSIFFVMNGDMVFNPNFNDLLDFHTVNGGIMSLFVTGGYIGNGGTVVFLDNQNKIIDWREKTENDAPENIRLNAGTYIMSREVSAFFPQKNSFSLENEVFPKIFRDRCYGLETDIQLIDIGVPERYNSALKMSSQILKTI
ncbi:MAG: sugar phosphate nucleotidyltransferase [bacterium]|nr:sugar phosphate nucleotidyltransferase [bacterium]